MTHQTKLRCIPVLLLLANACSAPSPGEPTVRRSDDPSANSADGTSASDGKDPSSSDPGVDPLAGPIDAEGDDSAPDLSQLPDAEKLNEGLQPASFDPEPGAQSPAGFVEASFSLKAYDTPVKNQSTRPWCTAFATVAGLENLVRHTFGVKDDLSEIDHFNAYRIYSVFPSVEAAKKTAIVPESAWPYWGNPIANYRSKAVARLTTSRNLTTRAQVQASLRAGKPVVVGMNLTPSWSRPAGGRISKEGAIGGGHAMLVVGYEDSAAWGGGGQLLFKNSWGTKWGDLGYAHVPYDYCTRIRCYFIELGGAEYQGKTHPIPAPGPEPTPAPAPTTIGEASFKVVADHKPDQPSAFRLRLDATAAVFAHVRKVTYDIHETFGNAQYSAVTTPAGGFAMTTWYTTYARRWQTNGVTVELDDGRSIRLDGAIVSW